MSCQVTEFLAAALCDAVRTMQAIEAQHQGDDRFPRDIVRSGIEAKLALAEAELQELRLQVEIARREANEAIARAHDASKERDRAMAERDDIAARLGELPPDISDDELNGKLYGVWFASTSIVVVDRIADVAREARRLLRGPVAPARPVEELANDLAEAWRALGDGTWRAVAKRARELGAR